MQHLEKIESWNFTEIKNEMEKMTAAGILEKAKKNDSAIFYLKNWNTKIFVESENEIFLNIIDEKKRSSAVPQRRIFFNPKIKK